MMMKMLMSDNELRYQMSDNELRPLQVLLERLWGSLGSLSGASRRDSKPPQNLSQNPLYIRHLYFTVGAPARETSPLKWASPGTCLSKEREARAVWNHEDTTRWVYESVRVREYESMEVRAMRLWYYETMRLWNFETKTMTWWAVRGFAPPLTE